MDTVKSSFRDPSGFLFWKDGVLYRQINHIYRQDYEKFINSGLYERLIQDGLLIPHEEIASESGETFKIIKPEIIPFVSYPYEWCFSQLKDAALMTLKIQKISLEYGMSLKDASAYNIQFKYGKPVLIDTLSFEKYEDGKPWVAYRQFCQHFLAPLALMAIKDVRLNQLLRIYIDGIPLELASRLMPKRSFLKFSLLTHIHLHAKTQKRFADRKVDISRYKVGKKQLLALMDSLESAISSLSWSPKGTEWANYYEDTNYTAEAMEHKKALIAKYLEETRSESVWDLGANTGIFSRIASERGIRTIAFDIDPSAVEKNYLEARAKREKNILPLLLDLTNPSPAIGWSNEERSSLIERGPADMVFALALIHHLAISNNLPFSHIASFLSKICRYLIIEFVPKEDSQVQRLLQSREDIFFSYIQEHFEHTFLIYFFIIEQTRLKDSNRTLYLMKNKGSL